MHVDDLGAGCNINSERGVLRGYSDPKSQKGLRGTGNGLTGLMDRKRHSLAVHLMNSPWTDSHKTTEHIIKPRLDVTEKAWTEPLVQ